MLLIAYLLSTLVPQPSDTVKFWASTIQNLAFIVLTVVIVDFLWQIVGGEPIRKTLGALAATLTEMRTSVALLEDSRKTGVQRLYSASGAAGTHRDWMKRLKEARKNVDLLGYTLHVWNKGENFENEMISLVKSGAKVRVLIMDETNPNLGSLVNEEQINSISLTSVQEEIKVAKRVFLSISAEHNKSQYSGSYEFRTLRRGLVVSQICRTDADLTAVQYLYSVGAARSPLVFVNGLDTELFKVYMNEFEHLWELGSSPILTTTVIVPNQT